MTAFGAVWSQYERRKKKKTIPNKRIIQYWYIEQKIITYQSTKSTKAISSLVLRPAKVVHGAPAREINCPFNNEKKTRINLYRWLNFRKTKKKKLHFTFYRLFLRPSFFYRSGVVYTRRVITKNPSNE